MKKDIPEQIQKELLLAFESVYTKTKLEHISERYGFSDKISTFSKMVKETFYGDRPVDQLAASIEKELGVSTEVAQYISIELDQELFSTKRDEFNVAQGLISPDEIMLMSEDEVPEESGATDSEQLTSIGHTTAPLSTNPAPEPPQTPESPTEPPASTKQHDPYREPIDE